MGKFITVAIHTYEKALALRALLESEGIAVELCNVNLDVPGFSSGVRVRIVEADLPLALRIIENRELFCNPDENPDSGMVLIPVDLSENSYKAACIGAHLAAKNDNKITLLYSYIDPYIAGNVQFTDTLTYEVGEAGARKQLAANAASLLDNFVHRLRTDMKRGRVPAVKIGTYVVEGVPEDVIVEYAKTNTPRLIIMGTRGAARKEKEMIGSVTAEVLDQSRLTLLSVPDPVEIEQILNARNILFISNLDQDDILAMDSLYRMLGATDANVSIMHVAGKRHFYDKASDKAIRRLNEYCSNNFTHFSFVSVPVSADNSEREFSKLNNENNFDLIVVPNRRRYAFTRIFNPGITQKILFRTDIPMLVIPV